MKIRHQKRQIKESLSRRIFLVCNTTFLVVFAIVCMLPFVNLLAISVSDAYAVISGEVGFLPVGFNLTAYELLLQDSEFWRSFAISVQRVLLGTLLGLVVNVLAAYPLSRSKKFFKGRKFYVILFVVTMFFSGGLVPTYMLITGLHIDDSIFALILPTAFNAWNVVLLISFFREVPHELIEAAEIDGASQYQILFNVVLPISLPALATVVLFTAVAHWNNWFDGLIYTSTNLPLQTFIYNKIQSVAQSFKNIGNMSPEQIQQMENLNERTLKSAQVFIAMLPIMLVYPFVQKYFIKGLTQGGVKE